MKRPATLHQALLRSALTLACAASLSACAGAADEPLDEPLNENEPVASDEQALTCSPSPPINIERSLLVTNPAVLAEFPLHDVFDQLLAQEDTIGQGPLELYQRWWDSQNTKAGAVFPDAIHCDDQKTANNAPAINGYPIQCPRNEGISATTDPFDASPGNQFHVYPTAIVNRFDLAPTDGSHCGEYRIIYAKRPGPVGVIDRNLFILEMVLPNPKPACGLAGCRPVAEFWANLSTISDPAILAAKIKGFYFNGLPGFQPAIRAHNLGLPSNGKRLGQIRTNQFMLGLDEQIWQLREFQLNLACGPSGCRLFFEPVTVKNNFFGALANPSFNHPNTAPFQSDFIATGQVEALSPQDERKITMAISDQYNAGESTSSTASTRGTDNEYAVHLLAGGPLSPFFQGISARLASSGRADITPIDIANRATTQSCAGCHELSSGDPLGGLRGLLPFTWPSHSAPLEFVHVDEDSNLSKPLTHVFLPHRKQVLASFLAKCVTCGGQAAQTGAASKGFVPGTGAATIGGSFTH